MFDLTVNKHICFTEEVPSNTDVHITFRAAPGLAQFIDVQLADWTTNVIWSVSGKDFGVLERRLQYGGDYSLCFYSRASLNAKVADGASRAINMDFKIGVESRDYQKVAVDRKLRPMEVRLQAIEDTVRSMHDEYVYYKEKEAEMRNTNEHMNAKVMWVTLFIIVIFVAFSIWQLRHLKKFFKKKRLID